MRTKVFIPIRDDEAYQVLNVIVDCAGSPFWLSRIKGLTRYFDVFVDAASSGIVQSIRSAKGMEQVVVYERKPDLMHECVSTNRLILDFLDRYRIQHEVIVQTHINHPFLRVESIQESIPLLQIDGDYDSIVAANRFQNRLWSSDFHGHFPINHNPMDLRRSSQLPHFWMESSAFYIFSASKFRALGNRVGLNPLFYEISAAEGLAIHTMDDWEQWLRICREFHFLNLMHCKGIDNCHEHELG
jgi:CMP-N-acetylneuraminic acid synthetase